MGLCEEGGGVNGGNEKGGDEKREWKKGDRLILRICFNVSFGVKCLKRQSFWVKTNIV